MIECRILGVDVEAGCIEVAFLVEKDWRLNRIFHPVDAQRKPVDLADPEQVRAYVEQYAMDNYGSPTKIKAEDGRFFVEEATVRQELGAINESLTRHGASISELSESLEHWKVVSEVVERDGQRNFFSLEEVKKAAEAREEAAELVFEKLRSQLRSNEGRFYQLEVMVNRLERSWWEKFTQWMKANSSLLGG